MTAEPDGVSEPQEDQLCFFEAVTIERQDIRLKATTANSSMLYKDTPQPQMNEVSNYLVRGVVRHVAYDNKADSEGNRTLTRIVTLEIDDAMVVTDLDAARLIRERG